MNNRRNNNRGGQIRHPNSTCRKQSERTEAAVSLAEERAKRSEEDQLKVLDKRLGKNKGAVKERARLKALIKNRTQ